MRNRVIAIDPGFDRIGVAVLDNNEILYSYCIETDRKLPHDKRLLNIGQSVKAVIKKWKPQTLAIENLFFNQNTSTAFKVSEARGVILYEASLAGLKIYEYSPQTVKMAVTGYGKANKIQMATMVKKLVNLPEKSSKRLDDEIDAIALGITHLATKKGI
ncbi:MAG: crossover junction endodeoxyribonuclease RuvC [Candidatus Zambryskibacteria bacterium RIFCSPHIGHO2_02_FULL_43_14]|uniref:Crossover junction endodeoxyribonuclease RuvC n=1 Tax=Candidatus Zambryskibacteria bacterium RIFCSPHIGHO2_02_FULL_43_14 TaxID=1802748 RepID=A0A1G2TK64_9BACT|nr:MAG: crossover junction endodeoxyribonuclease RuvC [Candidatus Zambryskibacteria bacterium RIFCSPHIGHO2_01_FULL_43_60]OHA97011.1 MAG: crossover junction endodeoxyribonuclease RuvC [Candidatus Zambryskibacteria bacterium RIFCSPHIGHO2_02_FULL_43_14]OHB03736.1 MAG: crossover junction endodeoxyribonuclease RuvC [Candidatus Zambryskibacteria bacterium RIFCSPLOWO2_01_FULL_42_41]